MIIRKAYKFRIYPNNSQQAALAVQFGHARFVYNHYRAVREGFYIDCGTGLTYNDCQDDMAEFLKLELQWLKDADSQARQGAIKDLDRAYVNFFEGRADYPTYKRKFGKQSIRYPQQGQRETGLPAQSWLGQGCIPSRH